MWFSTFTAHRKACAFKQAQRNDLFSVLKASHSDPLTPQESLALSLSLADVVSSCSYGVIAPSLVRNAYLKRTVAAHVATNCIADFLPNNHTKPQEKDSRPLLGVPISIKDCYDYEGRDTTLGYSQYVSRPAESSSVFVEMLLSAGATLHVKTTVPTGLLDLETSSDLYGYTPNPHNHNFAAGASTGGGAALLAYEGSKIEIGSDIGGSVRIPAHFSGVYGLKSSCGRFPEAGSMSCAPGSQALRAVAAPMANDLDDLEEFCHRFIDLKPWLYDPGCVPIPWKPCDFLAKKTRLRFGVIWDDGIIPPSPACRRALQLSVDALKQQGHDVVDFYPPSPLDGLKIGYRTAFSAGDGPSFSPLQPGEWINQAMRATKLLLQLPISLKRFIATLLRTFSKPKGRNDALAELIGILHPCTVMEHRQLVIQREEYIMKWQRKWNADQLDFVLTVPYATPAIPKGSAGQATLISASYCFLYNTLDYVAGVLPVTFVNKVTDALPHGFKQSTEYTNMNDIAQAVYQLYDAEAMDGLPVGVQVIGRRLEEEKVLGAMKVVRAALAAAGTVYRAKFS